MGGNSGKRCWPGYEPVPGKPAHSKGSCRPTADSKLTSEERGFRKKREAQLDRWEASHPGSPRSAAQHLAQPKKKSASKATGAAKGRSTTRRKTTRKRTSASARRSAS